MQPNKRAIVRGILTLTRVRLDRQKRTTREHSLDLLSLWPKPNQLEGSMSFDSSDMLLIRETSRSGTTAFTLTKSSFEDQTWRNLFQQREERLVSIVDASSRMMIRVREEKGRRRRFSISTIDDNRSLFSLSLSLTGYCRHRTLMWWADRITLLSLLLRDTCAHTRASNEDCCHECDVARHKCTHTPWGRNGTSWLTRPWFGLCLFCLWYSHQCRS